MRFREQDLGQRWPGEPHQPSANLPSRRLAVVLGVAGNYGRVEGKLVDTIRHLERALPQLDAELVIGFESESWLNTPFAQTIGSRFDESRLKVFCSSSHGLLAPIYNEAAKKASSDSLLFLWPGCYPRGDSLTTRLAGLEKQKLDWIASVDGELLGQLGLHADIVAERFMAYFLSCQSLFSLCQALIRRESLLELGGFSPSPILQRAFPNEWFHRAILRHARAGLVEGHLVAEEWSLEDFPFDEDLRVPNYLAHSFRLRSATDSDPVQGNRSREDRFAIDLPTTERAFIGRLLGREVPQIKHADSAAPCKLAVTGGIWEYAHNHLCFYNYFRLLESRGLFTYVPLLDLTLSPERDLMGVDAVIISRGRHPNILRTLEYCRLRSIPTVYMIDDNWFSVGKDWPSEYGHIFAPGMPAYEVFITCLRESDAVLLYNNVLEEDVSRYARRIIRLPANVSRNDFLAPLGNSRLAQPVEDLLQWRARTGGLIIGYVGTPRYTDAAFRAMASIARKRPEQTRIMLFGPMAPEHAAMLKDVAITLPYVPYEEYAAAMGRMAPDVLIAPLEECRTTRSKCPNKYLEYSIAGAAGVYSDLPPYSEVVRGGANGLLVATEDESAWFHAILSLVDDVPLRKRLAAAAREDVLTTYESAIVAPAFVNALLSVVRDGTSREHGMALGGKA